MAALEWDLDGDGAFDDAAGDVATRAFNDRAQTSVGLRARDRDGGEDVFRLSLVPGNRAPSAAFSTSRRRRPGWARRSPPPWPTRTAR